MIAILIIGTSTNYFKQNSYNSDNKKDMNNITCMVTQKSDGPGYDEYDRNDVQQISHFGWFIEWWNF